MTTAEKILANVAAATTALAFPFAVRTSTGHVNRFRTAWERRTFLAMSPGSTVHYD